MMLSIGNYFSRSYCALTITFGLLIFCRPLSWLPVVGPIMLSVIFSLILFFGLLRFIKTPKYQFLLGALILINTVLRFLPTAQEDYRLGICIAVVDFCVVSYFLWSVLKDVFNAQDVSSDTIFGGILSYLFLGLLFTIVYKIIELASPGSIRAGGNLLSGAEGGFDQLWYFSFVTLTTLGFGDIVPIGEFARSVCTLEAIAGQMLIAIIIARLVALHTASQLQP